ncbi:hypothetical protein EK21DRAFT_69675 [Setomelanomma holmii]|uniref:F-box domain-containing protein n=1 Tax=Setomelanomma holmii TaxID=210430 RepID=A0A9P4H7U3_9PLEO|nr:hypothetical protein EK21DRAFT_69675 [Setomelanomma holmii]
MAATEPGLDYLPDELLLHIVQQLSCIFSLEPQSTAFKVKAKEKSRQCDNRSRQLGLYSLCLANRHLRRIATPTLYSSFVGSTTWHGLKPLELFHRTITGPQDADATVPLGQHLEYVENRLSDYLGNSLQEDSQEDGADYMVARHFQLLAEIVNHAANIQYMSIVSLETVGASFWKYILSDISGLGSPALVASHGFPKLRSLCFQIHTRSYDTNLSSSSFDRICSAFTSAPMLESYQASGVVSSLSVLPLHQVLPLRQKFKKLTRVEMTECVLELDEVASVWADCERLRHIACEWAFLDEDGGRPIILYEGLLRHCETLDSLHLDMREVRIFESVFAHPGRLGSLQSFTSLKSLQICERSLLGSTDILLDTQAGSSGVRMTKLLPSELEKFVLLMPGTRSDFADDRVFDATILRPLADDCGRDMVALRDVIVKARHHECGAQMTKAFEDVGVRFRLVDEAKASY